MGLVTRESFKPRVRRLGAGIILVITLSFLIGAFVRDCGFFPGQGAAGGSTEEGDPTMTPAAAGPGDKAGGGKPGAGAATDRTTPGEPGEPGGRQEGGQTEEGVVVELERDQLVYRGAVIGWSELEALGRRTAAEKAPLTLSIDSSSVTFGFVERARELLERAGVRVVEDTR